jgi:UPF0716 protein FxsA
MPLLLLLLFIGVPILEIYVLIQVGQAIGVLPTIALLIVDSLLGAWLMRTQGRAAWRRFREALAAGRVPARETLDGALVIFGGALLLTPGFCSDVLGALLLLPPSRAVIARLLLRRATFRMVSNLPGGSFRGARRRPDSHDVEGTAHEVSDDPRQLP